MNKVAESTLTKAFRIGKSFDVECEIERIRKRVRSRGNLTGAAILGKAAEAVRQYRTLVAKSGR